MRSAVIVSTARTPLTRAWTGSLNLTNAATMGGHVVREALNRAGIDGGEVEDVVMGCANPEGANGGNTARQAALRAGLPLSTPGLTVSRFCGSGLQAIALAAQRIIADEADVFVAGGVESISLVQNELNHFMARDAWLDRNVPGIYWPMLRTAEEVGERYGISRERQDEYGLASHLKAAAAQLAGRFDEELAPIDTVMAATSADGEIVMQDVRVAQDDGIRGDSTLEGVSRIRRAVPGGSVSAGNASGFSDGASASVVMSEDRAATLGLDVLGRFAGFAVTGCDPEVMGIGPATAVPKLLERAGLTVADIDLWELNEAFASQVLYCRDVLGIDDSILNVDGGAIAVGHPYGCSGARLTGHVLLEARRRKVRRAVVTMCIGGGQGVAALFELL
ncbi:MAG: acetyl-CoA C-acetyltransferase [Actinomycetota bacterium]|nr:acetyl-CoA C-acetyltransferase [Actinomycetota bacterium]